MLFSVMVGGAEGYFSAFAVFLRASTAQIGVLASLLALQAADHLDVTYWGFVTIFLLGAAARFASAWYLQRMHDPGGHVAALEAPWHADLWQGLKQTGLLHFSLFHACMQLAVGIASPFFTLYMLRDLEFSYLQFMANTAASVCLQFLTLNRWGQLSDLFGNRLILLTTGVVIPFLPALWLVSTNYFYLLGVQALSGLVWAGFTLSATNFVFDLTPAERRATLMAVHNVLAAAAVFLGAVLGGWLGTHFPTALSVAGWELSWLTPLYGVFALSALLRLVVAAVFLPRLKEVRRARPMSMSGLIFRVTRIHPVSGMMFEIVARRRRDEGNERDD